MTEQFPGYDVMQKRDGLSWDDITRRVIDARLNVPRTPRFFNEAEWRTLAAICDQIMPQPVDREKVPLPCYVDDKIFTGQTDGYRYPGMPHQGEAWRRGLAALDEAAQRDFGGAYHALESEQQQRMLADLQHDRFRADALGDMPAKTFFSSRVLADIVNAYYAHPTSWNEIGWAGPASPRGYVRLQNGLRDQWEPAEAAELGPERARRENLRVR